jgi:hypothetical protein
LTQSDMTAVVSVLMDVVVVAVKRTVLGRRSWRREGGR